MKNNFEVKMRGLRQSYAKLDWFVQEDFIDEYFHEIKRNKLGFMDIYSKEIEEEWRKIKDIYSSLSEGDARFVDRVIPDVKFYIDNEFSIKLFYQEIILNPRNISYIEMKKRQERYRNIILVGIVLIIFIVISPAFAKVGETSLSPYSYTIDTGGNSIQLSAGGSVVSSTIPISSGLSGAAILLNGPPELRSGDSGVIRLNLKFVTNTNGLQAYIPLPEVKPYSVTSRLQPASFRIEPSVAGLREEQRLALNEQPAKWAWSIETPDTRLGDQEVVIDILIKDDAGHIISDPSTLKIEIKDPVGTPSSTVYSLRIVGAVIGLLGSLGLLAFIGRTLLRWWKKVRSPQRTAPKSKTSKSSHGKRR
jgi:hypothetical protein